MRAIVVRTLFAVVLGTGIAWGGAASASASASTSAPAGHGTTITIQPDDGHDGHDGDQCSATTAWGSSWCPRKPLD